METDRPIDFKLDEFCSRCKICAENCPTQAISLADQPDFEIRGLRRFYTNHAKCSDGWSLGAGPMGCRACVAACPWSRRNTWAHRLVRNVLSRDPTGLTHAASIWAEKNMYPKNALDDLNPPKFLGVFNPPDWIVTANYVDGFTETPMGVK